MFNSNQVYELTFILNSTTVVLTHSYCYLQLTVFNSSYHTEASGLPTLFQKQRLSDALLFQAPTSLVFICVENYVISVQLKQVGLHNVNV